MSADYRLDLPRRLSGGPADLVAEWNRMVEAMKTLDRAMRARTIRPGDGTRINVSPSGTTIGVLPRSGRSSGGVLPFQISVTPSSIKAAAGVLDGDSIAATVESSPANGTWYLEAKVTINATTGVVTATAVQWTLTTPSTSTTTDFYQIIGEVDVVAGVPDASSIIQYDYGPLIVVQFGDVSDKWGVLIF